MFPFLPGYLACKANKNMLYKLWAATLATHTHTATWATYTHTHSYMHGACEQNRNQLVVYLTIYCNAPCKDIWIFNLTKYVEVRWLVGLIFYWFIIQGSKGIRQ